MQKFYQFIVIVSLCGSTYASSSSIFHLVPNTHDVSQGRGATLNCALKDEYADVYTLSWVMDSRDAANDRRKIGPEGRLHIEKVDKDLDKGQFQCVATNRSNPNDQVFTNPASLNIKWLDIYGVIRLSPDSEEVLPGNKVIMKCNVSGKPRPQVQEIYWKRGDNRINKDAEDGLYSYNRARIIIDRVELGKFDGRYSCCIGEECSHIKYDLKVRDKATPVLVKKPKDTVVRVRSNAVLSCKFDAVPEPKVEWYHDDDPIKIKPPDSCRICAFKNGTLLVKDVKDRFQGIYKCVATGDNGQTADGSAELSLAYIKISDGNIEEELLDPGQNDEKYCGHVDAKPEASITWYKDDQLITNSSMTGITVYGSTLIINSAQQSDEGKYKCVAVNVAGNVTKLYNFRIKSEWKTVS